MKRQRGAGAGENGSVPSALLSVDSDALATENGSQSTSGKTGPVFRLWFAARPGPPRPSTVILAGQRVRVKRSRPELPPGPNGSRGNPYGHARWVKDWRQAASSAAIQHLMPRMERAHISAVMHRRALGTADEDNDRARLKPLVDGLRDAGVIPKDTREHVVWGSVTEERAGVDGPGVLLIVEPLEHAAPEPPGGVE